MATWTDSAVLIASLASGKAYTDEKAQAQVENPVAIAEGAINAPKVIASALDTLYGAWTMSTTYDGVNDIPSRVEFIRVDISMYGQSGAGGSTTFTLQAAVSADNGATLGGVNTVIEAFTIPVSAIGFIGGSILINKVTGAFRSTIRSSATGFLQFGGFNAIRFRVAVTGTGGAVPTGQGFLTGIHGIAP